MYIEWIMTGTTKDVNSGSRWLLTSMLEYLDSADDIGLLPSRRKDTEEMVEKTNSTTVKLQIVQQADAMQPHDRVGLNIEL